MKMKKNLYRVSVLIILVTSLFAKAICQDEDADVPKKKAFVALKYYNVENSMQFLTLQCDLKSEKGLEHISKLGAKIYLDDETDEANLIESIKTDQDGRAKIYLPVSFKDKWIASPQHKFIAVTDSIPELGVRNVESEVTIAKLTIDTISDGETKSVTVKLVEKKENNWVPVKDVEIKLGIKRLGSSMLPIGDEPTVTTDSSGTAVAEFTVKSIPGDKSGNIILIARIEDNDVYGNLEASKNVNWGTTFISESNFGKRSLWATGGKTPIWLLSIAGLIVFSVWGTIIYLVFSLINMRKLGLK